MTKAINSALIDVYCISCGETDAFYKGNLPDKYVCDKCWNKEKQKDVEQ